MDKKNVKLFCLINLQSIVEKFYIEDYSFLTGKQLP